MQETLSAFFQNIYPDIQNTEKAAIYFYTQTDYPSFRQLNKQLREWKLSNFNKAFSELLSKAINKLEPIEKGTEVYRSIRLDKTHLQEFINNAIGGKEVVFNGFTSASIKKEVSNNFLNKKAKNNETDVLLVIKSKNGKSIENFSQFGGRFEGYPNQHEVLFDKGTKFKFEYIEKDNGKTIFHLIEE